MPTGVITLTIVTLLGLGLFLAWRRSADRVGAYMDSKLLAVLPFENLGDPSNAYFADGVSDAVRGKLAALPGLQVIAGASSGEYRSTTKPPQQIARELGVRYLLVGKVGREGKGPGQGRVRVSPELVEVRIRGAPTTKWQEPFEAPLADIFQVQADVARHVAEALGVALGSSETVLLSERPTQNLAAYEAFLRGEQQIAGSGTVVTPVALRRVLPYYEQAIALDSTFFEAWAQLSRAHSFLYGNGPASLSEGEAAHMAAERSLALAPNRAEARLALGDYYSLVQGDLTRALGQYALGLRLAPSNVDLLTDAGQAESYLGRWQAALEHFRRAQLLDPRSPAATLRFGETLLRLRQYAEAHAAIDRALVLVPSSLPGIQAKAMIHLAQGDLAQARQVVRAGLTQVEPATLVAYFGYYWDLYWVLEEPEQQLLLRLPPSAFDNSRAAWGLVLAQTFALRGDETRARVYADSSRIAFEEQLRGAPSDGQLHALYGLALAYLGRKADAVREGELGLELLPPSKHSTLGPYVQHQLVRIYLLVGNPEKALNQLEPLLKIPYLLSPGWLRIDPSFDPLRGDSRFQRLLKSDVALPISMDLETLTGSVSLQMTGKPRHVAERELGFNSRTVRRRQYFAQHSVSSRGGR
jgi:eukaryotic-like serine/threonine-protein kinase